MRAFRFLLASTFLLVACEDGPEQIFEPNTGDVTEQNGYDHTPPLVLDEDKTYAEVSTGDSQGRARFCDETENSAVVEEMVTQPIVPDVSVGGVPLWAEDGGPMHADDLVGRPEEGKFCDPWGIYLDAFTWGPTQDLIVFFNEETRLVEGIIAYGQYLGTLEGSYTNGSGEQVPIVLKNREKVVMQAGTPDRWELDAYSKTDPSSWLNPVNINAIYRMVRETHFGDDPADLAYDCVERQICDVIYTANDESRPQETVIVFWDSSVFVLLSPEGDISYIEADPVRIQQFEIEVEVAFDGITNNPSDDTLSMEMKSVQVPSCVLTLDESDGVTWAEVKTRCDLDSNAEARLDYDVHISRDAVDVGFNSVTLTFLRDLTAEGKEALADGEHPADDDTLIRIGFGRTLNANAHEFVPSDLVSVYETKLRQALADAVDPDHPDRATHPFVAGQATLDVLPEAARTYSFSSESRRIGEITYFVENAPVRAQVDDGRYATAGTDDSTIAYARIPSRSSILAGSVKLYLGGDETIGSGTLLGTDANEDGTIVPEAGYAFTATVNYESGFIEIAETGTDVWTDGDTVDVEYQTHEQRSLMADTIKEVAARYDELTLEQKLMVDKRATYEIFAIEPFVDAVIEQFVYGLATPAINPDVFKVFTTTDDRRWSIADASFFDAQGAPCRMSVQYSMNYGAVTWVSLERGYNAIGEIFVNLNERRNAVMGEDELYYTLAMSQEPVWGSSGNPYALNGRGITVNGFDRQLGMLDVELATLSPSGESDTVSLSVAGDPIEDENGYMRQLRGERWEFIPADVVELRGKESIFFFFVESDGRIGRIAQAYFKGAPELCEGLPIAYGDDVPKAIDRWKQTVTTSEFRNCELVFNYSDNGNVLDSVVSLTNKVQFHVMDARAFQAAVWR